MYMYVIFIGGVSGLQVTCTGNPGHGSRFIENTAVEKLVSLSLLCCVVTT